MFAPLEEELQPTHETSFDQNEKCIYAKAKLQK